ANAGVDVLTAEVAPALLDPPGNALRVTLHPDGMAPAIVNFAEWSSHLLDRLRRQIELTADGELQTLYDELAAYPQVVTELRADSPAGHEILLPLRLRHAGEVLELFSTVTTFG